MLQRHAEVDDRVDPLAEAAEALQPVEHLTRAEYYALVVRLNPAEKNKKINTNKKKNIYIYIYLVFVSQPPAVFGTQHPTYTPQVCTGHNWQNHQLVDAGQ